jgi:hypothetical protein
MLATKILTVGSVFHMWASFVGAFLFQPLLILAPHLTFLFQTHVAGRFLVAQDTD